MIISPSQIASYKKCKRSWYYGYVDKLTSNEVNPNFWLGTAVHTALAEYYKENDKNFDTLINAFNKWVSENDKSSEQYQQLKLLGKSMLQSYWHYDIAGDKIKVLAVEKLLQAPILNEMGEQVGIIQGIIDLVIEDSEGNVIIIDHKTSSSNGTGMGLDVDYQMTTYTYLWYKNTGILPSKILHNILKKDLLEKPKVTRNGLSRDKNQKTSYELYVQAIEENELDIEDYNEILEYLKSKHSVNRLVSSRTIAELQEYERMLIIEHNEMEQSSKSFSNCYTNPSVFNCNYCAFLLLCTAQNKKENTTFIRETYYQIKQTEDLSNYE